MALFSYFWPTMWQYAICILEWYNTNSYGMKTWNKENQKWVDQRKLLSQSEDSKEFPKEIVNAAMADISQQIFHKRHNHILLTCYKLFPQTSNSKVPNVITIQSAIHPSVSVMSTILRHKMVRYLMIPVITPTLFQLGWSLFYYLECTYVLVLKLGSGKSYFLVNFGTYIRHFFLWK